MGLPNIEVTFRTVAASAVKRSEKGIVAIIVEDAAGGGDYKLSNITDVPAALGVANKGYVERAFIGNSTPPRKVLLYVMDGADKTLDDALKYFASKKFDYLVGTPDITAEDTEKIASWIKSERQNDHMVKAVLPNLKADHEAIVNFTTGGIKTLAGEFAAAQYCSRIAGLIVGTPLEMSCTSAPLPEVLEVERLSNEQISAAIDAGELVIFHDGEKVKVGRGVNSLTTTTQDKGEAFKKIKIVEALDMIFNDLRLTLQDNYIGKYANSYANKCLLVVAVQAYFEKLEQERILKKGFSTVAVDEDAQRLFLKGQGADVDNMSDQEIKEADTGSNVFLSASIKPLDAIEDVVIPIIV